MRFRSNIDVYLQSKWIDHISESVTNIYQPGKSFSTSSKQLLDLFPQMLNQIIFGYGSKSIKYLKLWLNKFLIWFLIFTYGKSENQFKIQLLKAKKIFWNWFFFTFKVYQAFQIALEPTLTRHDEFSLFCHQCPRKYKLTYSVNQ